MNSIKSFDGSNRWLSNFWLASVSYEGDTFASVENAYQAAKTPRAYRAPFLTCAPGFAKRLGRTVQLVDNWEGVKERVMRDMLALKFAPGSNLADFLLRTSDAHLEEGNTWGDRYWGTVGGIGKNRLGILLMEQREKLQLAAMTNGDLF